MNEAKSFIELKTECEDFLKIIGNRIFTNQGEKIMKKAVFFIKLGVVVFLLAGLNAYAQSATTFTGGLQAPSKIISTPEGNLLVAEGGNAPNTGRITLVERSGNRRTLITGLPSGPTAEGGLSGPTGLALQGRTLYVCIGQGDSTIAGSEQGTEIPNPSPSSTLFSTVLAIQLKAPVDATTGDFTMSVNDQLTFQIKPEVVLVNASGEKAFVRVLANFRNFTFGSRPNIVRPSNPFGIALIGKNLYTTDAGQNLVWETNINTGETNVLVYLNNKANPLPFGPPFVEPVPDSIRAFGKQLLVTYLTGFPFPAGQSEVHKINRVNNSHTTFIGGLSTAIDVLPVEGANGQTRFYVLEFSTAFLTNAPGRLLLYESPSAAPKVLAEGLVSPTSIARDETSGDLFITEMFTGRIMRASGN
jgi:hypothetical protein